STGEIIWALISILLLFTVSGCPQECRCNTALKTVDCRAQELKEIPTKLPYETELLYLQDNKIQVISHTPFITTPWLKILDLSNNSITSVSSKTFHGLHHLQVLNLTNNFIQHIENKVFNQLQNLHKLDLSFNRLLSLPESLGDNIKNLTLVAVHHNLLQRIQRVLLDSLSNLEVFLFKDNPWHCNCEVIGFRLWLESFLYRGGTIDEIVCFSPEDLKGKDLFKVPYEKYRTCSAISSSFLLANIKHFSSDPKGINKHLHHDEHGDGSHSDCETKPKPRPVSLRHAIATVVITGVVCGIVCLMMLAAAIYGCAYAAIMAKYHKELKKVEHLAPAIEQGSAEEKEPLDSSLA
uniref:Leucine rich repeats and transmembrane domains 1 n=1 Tax=Latimeria chalumnae TaxID=7897 RepID=H3A4U1_LATCH